MHREESQENHYRQQHKINYAEYGIQPPGESITSSVPPTNECYNDCQQRQSQAAVRVPRYRGYLEGCYLFVQHQRCAIGECGLGHVEHELLGEEETLLVGHELVCLFAKYQVNAQVHPRIGTCIVRYGGAEWLVFVAMVRRDNGILQRLFQQVIGARSTVVEYKIVVINAVLGLIIHHQGIKHLLLLRWREIEFLLISGAPNTLIETQKIGVGFYAQLIVGVALDKLEVEPIVHQGEDTVVEDNIQLVGLIKHANACMSVLRPHFGAWGASQEIDLGAITQEELCAQGSAQ